VKHGRTIALAHLTQQVPAEDPDARVLATVEDIRRVTRTATGQEISASSMLERFGFTGDKLTARLGDLSGGERRRFQLLKLLLSEPNVLLLDEPTNDLDIDTLNVLEDFLDGWPGTLVVVSHDRYFLERVTDTVWALLGDGTIGLLPGGVDQYLDMRRSLPPDSATSPVATAPEVPTVKARVGGADERAARKALTRIDRQLERIAVQEAALNGELAAAASDYAALAKLSEQLRLLLAEKETLEAQWLEAAAILE
jgi:ATP-binding cassette subfamily F protein uup